MKIDSAAEEYRRRWRVARHFHRVKHEPRGQIRSLGEPCAAIFALCAALAADNILAWIKGLMRG